MRRGAPSQPFDKESFIDASADFSLALLFFPMLAGKPQKSSVGFAMARAKGLCVLVSSAHEALGWEACGFFAN